MNLSVAVVALNEEEYLPLLLEDLVNQTYNLKNVELLLIDSLSNDKTYKIMVDFKNKYVNKFNNIRVFNNIGKKQASGWNIAIENFEGNYLTRLDAHSRIKLNFLEEVKIAIDEGEDIVGGPRFSLSESDDKWSQLLLIAESSMFGSGFSKYRKNSTKEMKKEYVNTMFHATYSRRALRSIDGFNESLGRTEDNDFHYRLRQENYKLRYSSNIVSYQYVRPGLCKMLKQKYSNGFWIGKTTFINRRCLSLFHYVPFIFVMGIVCSIFIDFIIKSNFLLILLSVYFLFGFVISILELLRNKKINCLMIPIIFFLLHTSYGVGTVVGLLKGVGYARFNKKIKKNNI
ncbi:glycosyltransferase [Vagococcus fluvialis]|uniref:glycosyltransferase n=1 Tax=Vagococcus fluvialis TaxID=2738 RepID=UPI003B214531